MNIAVRFLIIFCFLVINIDFQKRPTWNETPSFKQFLNNKINFNFSKILAAGGSASDKARSLYYYVAGPPTSGYPAGFTGPSNGLFGELSDITGHASIKAAFKNNGISSCSQIPTQGSISVSGHTLSGVTLNFSPGKLTIPSHFSSNPGGTFNTRIEVDSVGVHLMTIELDCQSGSDIISGYMLIDTGKSIETYYQYNTTTGERQLDIYMNHDASDGNAYDEQVALRFESSDGDDYEIWGIRTTDDATEGSYGVALHGNHDTQKAELSVVEDNDALPDVTTALHSGVVTCVDLSDDQTTTGCPTVNAAVANTYGSNFTISDTSAIDVSEVELLRISAEPEYDFGSVNVGSSSSYILTVSNVGSVTATSLAGSGLATPFSFTGGSYPGTSGTCGASLSAGSDCTIDVSYSPSSAGAHTDTILIDYDNGITAQQATRDLLGTGVSAIGPAVAIEQSVTETIGSCTFSSQTDPTNILNIKFKVLFSSAINDATFTTADISNSGGATVLAWVITNCGDNQTYKLEATAILGEATVVPNLAAGLVQDVSANSNSASTSVDNSVYYDSIQPVVTIEQAVLETVGTCSFSTQADPANTLNLEYRVSFSEAINDATFTTADISNVGTGGATLLTWALTNCGDDQNYKLEATAIVGDGTIAPNLAASLVQDPSANNNAASTSTDNYVTYNSAIPSLLVISESSPFDYGSVNVGSSLNHIFVVDNVGGVTATAIFEIGLTSPFSFTGSVYPGTTGTCTSTLAPATNCTLDIEFSPLVASLQFSTIMLNYNDGVTTQLSTRDIQGTGGSITGPDVIIEQSVTETIGSCLFSAQADPVNSLNIEFKVLFSSAIDDATFTTSDISNFGTGGATVLVWAISNCGDDQNYKLEATAIVGDGTIEPNIAAGLVQDPSANNNTTSTSVDNNVIFDSFQPDVTIEQAILETVGTCSFSAQADPTNALNLEYRVSFSEAINDATFTTADISNAGTGGATVLTWSISNCGNDQTYKLEATAITGFGTIVPNLAAGVVQDMSTNNNSASASTDNTVTFNP